MCVCVCMCVCMGGIYTCINYCGGCIYTLVHTCGRKWDTIITTIVLHYYIKNVLLSNELKVLYMLPEEICIYICI